MDYSLLIRLILAHLLSDFVFQPTKWAEDKDANGFSSHKLYKHVLVTGIVAVLLVWDSQWLFPVVVLSVIHGLIDGIKGELNRHNQKKSPPVYLLLTDQIIHFLTIGITWILVTNQTDRLSAELTLLLQSQKFWLYLLGYTWISFPVAIIIGKITEGWSNELNNQQLATTNYSSSASKDKFGLKNAGKWIGIIERILILTFVLNLQFAAIGFMLAAKSVFRFGDLKEGKDHQKTEYIIIGTFLSFMLSILTGIVLNYLSK